MLNFENSMKFSNVSMRKVILCYNHQNIRLKDAQMDILHVLGFAGGVIVFFVTLYYIGLNRWLVQEHAKIHSEFSAIKAELAALRK